MLDIQQLPNFLSFNEIPKDYFKNIKSLLIVHSHFAKKNDLLEKLNLLLENKSISYFNTSDLEYSSEIIEYESKIFQSRYELVISIGGGSSIDIAKIIYARLIFSNWQKDIKKNLIQLNIAKTKLMVISTLPGSGAEVSKTAVLNSKSDKFFFTSSTFVPQYVFYDIKSAIALKKNILIIRLVDAIIHSLESKNSILKNSFSDVCAEYVINNSANLLKDILKTKSNFFLVSDIKKLCIFSLYGGMAQSETGSGLCHALAHTLENKFNIPHAESIFLCSMILFQYKKKSTINQKEVLIYKLISQLYIQCFTKSRIKKHNAILKELSIVSFICEAKKDLCWKLEKKKIKEKNLINIFKDKVRAGKWNI